MQCIMKRMVTIAMNQTNSGNTLTNGYHQSMFNTIIVVLLLGFCAKYYGKEECDAIEKCKKAAVARAKTKKTKGEFIYCVCATVLQKREYVVRIRTEEYMYMCTHGVHTYISNASSLQFVHKLFFSIFIFLYVMYLFDTSGETVHYYIHVCTYIFYSSTLTTYTSSLLGW